jgi:hypothetical protein
MFEVENGLSILEKHRGNEKLGTFEGSGKWFEHFGETERE